MAITLASFANDSALPLQDVIAAGVAMGRREAINAYVRRRAALAVWAMLPKPQAPYQYASEPDAPPPVATPEMAPLPLLRLAAGGMSTRVDSTIGTIFKMGLQELSKLSHESLGLTLSLLGEHVADAVEDTLIDKLEAATFASAQREASALSATSLGSAMLKHAALRTTNGGLGPQPVHLLCAPDAAVTYANVFPREIPGVTVAVSRFLPTGRWYLLPPANRAPVSLMVDEEPIIEDMKFLAGAGVDYELRVYLPTTKTATAHLAADGSPRWTIKGGV